MAPDESCAVLGIDALAFLGVIDPVRVLALRLWAVFFDLVKDRLCLYVVDALAAVVWVDLLAYRACELTRASVDAVANCVIVDPTLRIVRALRIR